MVRAPCRQLSPARSALLTTGAPFLGMPRADCMGSALHHLPPVRGRGGFPGRRLINRCCWGPVHRRSADLPLRLVRPFSVRLSVRRLRFARSVPFGVQLQPERRPVRCAGPRPPHVCRTSAAAAGPGEWSPRFCGARFATHVRSRGSASLFSSQGSRPHGFTVHTRRCPIAPQPFACPGVRASQVLRSFAPFVCRAAVVQLWCQRSGCPGVACASLVPCRRADR